MNVVVVESPAKAKTINKYLGPGYKVLASFGHVRDLPAKDGSVKPDEDFDMTWQVDTASNKRLKEISDAVKDSDGLILATDLGIEENLGEETISVEPDDPDAPKYALLEYLGGVEAICSRSIAGSAGAHAELCPQPQCRCTSSANRILPAHAVGPAFSLLGRWNFSLGRRSSLSRKGLWCQGDRGR